mmetsp:Transcript_17539/g.20330  ORF Transcript_17539/g.20330 Transcript_17539/m.20330 type:complete len:629 (+) Transcript_17539:298-2184(+)|eukprot:CAMPEP_0184020942 /NCGR_PEP_ID=MMETSP0954-20121128/9638_1 /TAXON_ID=627963 /ORGANISM="Aplanochytrium sp, Strain PBS07" /LENGTH=628 /DNA_ID=CAMNT_0026302877 /DNA_START=311 /DNA_END=2200 /DNA_ORIENTATION=+
MKSKVSGYLRKRAEKQRIVKALKAQESSSGASNTSIDLNGRSSNTPERKRSEKKRKYARRMGSSMMRQLTFSSTNASKKMEKSVQFAVPAAKTIPAEECDSISCDNDSPADTAFFTEEPADEKFDEKIEENGIHTARISEEDLEKDDILPGDADIQTSAKYFRRDIPSLTNMQWGCTFCLFAMCVAVVSKFGIIGQVSTLLKNVDRDAPDEALNSGVSVSYQALLPLLQQLPAVTHKGLLVLELWFTGAAKVAEVAIGLVLLLFLRMMWKPSRKKNLVRATMAAAARNTRSSLRYSSTLETLLFPATKAVKEALKTGSSRLYKSDIAKFIEKANESLNLVLESEGFEGISLSTMTNFFEGLHADFASTSYEQLTPDQQQVFQAYKVSTLKALEKNEQLQKSSNCPVPDDFTLLRFLQSEKYQIAAATDRLIRTLQWRQEMDFNSLATNPPPILKRYKSLWSRKFLGFDHEGRPVVALRLGDFITAFERLRSEAVSINEVIRCYAYDYYQCVRGFRQSFLATGKPVWKVTVCADMTGVRFLAAMKSLPYLLVLTREIECHFPEIAGKIFLINSPFVVHKLWETLKTKIDPVLVGKISIHSGVPKDELLQLMHARVLPRAWGGTNKVAFP